MRARRGFAQQKRGVPSRPLLFVTCRFRGTRGLREVWRRSGPLSRRNTWKAALSVPLPGLWQCKRACAAKVCVAVVSRSVFLSGKAAKKNYEHPQRVSPDARSGGVRGLSVAEMGSRSVFLSGQAAKKKLRTPMACQGTQSRRDCKYPYAPSRSPSTTALAYLGGE